MNTATSPGTCHRITAPPEYGAIAPLVLSAPDHPPLACPSPPHSAACRQSINADLRLLRPALAGDVPARHRTPHDPDDRARYRWIVGHQTAFGVWQLKGAVLRALAHSDNAPQRLVAQAAQLYDVYSALFLYTGSCSAERYAATVRPDMTARHPAFSGEWARDHEAIPGLLSAVRARHPREAIAALTQAARRNQQVHIAVARKLVPDGASLLATAGREPGTGRTDAERDLYDDHFKVRRQAVCRPSFDAQLVRRLTQCFCDITTYDLDEPDDTSTVNAFSGPEAAAVLRDLAETLTGTYAPLEGILR
ncbi:hypothetical protein ABT030_03065 [Streptomyces mirabilis]|uniref:hypothetical protein n=1 Tax=Streptomyces mirabilis TaxID=68239 RepID=UPI0033290899